MSDKKVRTIWKVLCDLAFEIKMGVRNYNIYVYGVKLNYEDAKKVFVYIAEKGFWWQDFKDLKERTKEDWNKIHELEINYRMLKIHDTIDYEYLGKIDLVEFLDYHDFFARYFKKYMEEKDIYKTRLSFDPSSDMEVRYNIDLLCENVNPDSSLRLLPAHESIFGVYIAKESPSGYYVDKIKEKLEQPVFTNYEKYCVPVLKHLNISAEPDLYEIKQIY